LSIETNVEATVEHRMERRIIRVDCLPDQAGIAAALRRAFAHRPEPARFDEDEDPFAELLRRLH
jgi:hypothetical protein